LPAYFRSYFATPRVSITASYRFAQMADTIAGCAGRSLFCCWSWSGPGSSALSSRPVVFVAGDKRFRIRPAELGVQSDWRAAVDDAQRQGSGFGPLRGI